LHENVRMTHAKQKPQPNKRTAIRWRTHSCHPAGRQHDLSVQRPTSARDGRAAARSRYSNEEEGTSENEDHFSRAGLYNGDTWLSSRRACGSEVRKTGTCGCQDMEGIFGGGGGWVVAVRCWAVWVMAVGWAVLRWSPVVGVSWWSRLSDDCVFWCRSRRLRLEGLCGCVWMVVVVRFLAKGRDSALCVLRMLELEVGRVLIVKFSACVFASA